MNKSFKLLKNGYRFNRLVFQIGIILAAISWLILLFVYGTGSNLYYRCPVTDNGNLCYNPFYKDCYLNTFISCYDGEIPSEYSYIRDLPVLQEGFVMGRAPGFFVAHFTEIFVCILALCFLINHLLYNRRRK
jgi:hypothetical protein